MSSIRVTQIVNINSGNPVGDWIGGLLLIGAAATLLYLLIPALTIAFICAGVGAGLAWSLYAVKFLVELRRDTKDHQAREKQWSQYCRDIHTLATKKRRSESLEFQSAPAQTLRVNAERVAKRDVSHRALP